MGRIWKPQLSCAGGSSSAPRQRKRVAVELQQQQRFRTAFTAAVRRSDMAM